MSENIESESELTFNFWTQFPLRIQICLFIVITESILSGGTDLLPTLSPLYLVMEGIPIQYLG